MAKRVWLILVHRSEVKEPAALQRMWPQIFELGPRSPPESNDVRLNPPDVVPSNWHNQLREGDALPFNLHKYSGAGMPTPCGHDVIGLTTP
jgi:hypothetical protein